MKDPLWKIVLNWGAVIIFLTLPLVIFMFQLWNWIHPGFLQLGPNVEANVEYLREFLRNITILVFGLAGLRTWEHIKNGNNKDKIDWRPSEKS
jgi:hypothetical protein